METVNHSVRLLSVGILSALALFAGGPGVAAAAQPVPWQLSFQPAVTNVMDDIRWFNTFTLVIITMITILVLVLLVICAFRFNRKANPNPSKTSHHAVIEVVWTVVPIFILVIIALPSYRLLEKELTIPPADLTVKAVGYQWYWGYEYPDVGADAETVSFESFMLATDAERAERAKAFGVAESEYPRLLAVDNEMVVPVDKTVRLQVTAADVLHAFAMPAFGVKIDAVPGRLNETWFRARKTGLYYGQCSELCGKDHAYMPIAVRVVTEEQYDAWLAAAGSDLDAANALLAAMIEADKDKVKVARR